MISVFLAAATAEQITGVLDILMAIADAILGMVTSLVDLVMSQPLLLIPIGVTLLYTVINVFRRIF